MSLEEEHEDRARRLVEASSWRVHLTTIDAESTAEFEAWLASDPLNAEAWTRVEATWAYLGDHAAEPVVVAARSAALGTTPQFGRPTRPPMMPWRMAAAAAVCVLIAFGAGVYWWLQPVDYQTAIGERRTLVLSDGSLFTLDSDSELRVSYSARARNLALIRGQARFEVAHDALRPFLVAAGGAIVRAIGTDFDVDLPPVGVVVTLIRGRVAVSDARDRVPLTAGEQLTLAPGRRPMIAPVDVGDVLAWQNGQVVFHNAPLASVVDRMNRYDQAQLVLADPALAALTVSGTFNTGDAASFADIITRYLKIRAVYTDTGRIEFRRS
jgi:transmembrane sensor